MYIIFWKWLDKYIARRKIYGILADLKRTLWIKERHWSLANRLMHERFGVSSHLEMHGSRISDHRLSTSSEIMANFDTRALEVHNSSENGIGELGFL
jgi:hypothetical protein